MKQNDFLEPSNVIVNNKNKKYFEMGLEINAIIENLATLTIYNWRLANTIDCLIFLTVSYIWNNIWYVDDNGKSFALIVTLYKAIQI